MKKEVHARWPLLLPLLLVSFAAEATEAEDTDESGAASKAPGILVSWRGLTDDQLELAAQKAGEETTAKTLYLSAFEPAFIDALRQRLVPSRLEVAAKYPDLCRPHSPSFLDILHDVVKAIDFQEVDRARDLLYKARLAATCESTPFARATIGRYLFLTGVVRLYQYGDDGGIFEAALWTAPDLPFPAEFPALVRKAFEHAQEAPPSPGDIAVELSTEISSGLEIRVDGVLPMDRRIYLHEGEHALQIVAPDGTSWASTILSLSHTSSQTPLRWPPAALRPPDAMEVTGELALSVSRGKLRDGLRSALLAEMEERERSWMVVVVPGDVPGKMAVMKLEADGAESYLTVMSTGGNALGRERSRSAKRLAGISAALGGAAAVSGGTYAFVYYRANLASEIPEPATWDQYFLIGRISGTATFVCLAGAATTAILALRARPPRDASRTDARILLRPRVSFEARSVGLALGGTW